MHTPNLVLTGQFTLRLFVALLLGSVVGLERQWRQRMAGTRTNALVAAEASAFVLSALLIEGDPSASGELPLTLSLASDSSLRRNRMLAILGLMKGSANAFIAKS